VAAWAQGPPLRLRQVWARIDPANPASAAVARRAGFRRLGVAAGTEIWARSPEQRLRG
jgi:RimJ/RimL family protein N-acetyltransferase